jgi:chromosome partitioning protein
MKNPDLHTITVANLKGGVGKTTTAVSLAAGLAMKGRRTLLVDMDSQTSATAHLLDGGTVAGAATIFDVFDGEKGLREAAVATHVEGLSLLTTGDRRDRYESLDRSRGQDELALKKTIAGLKGGQLDYVVIDTPPSIDNFSVNAIAASDWIIVPVTCEYLPLLGLRRFNQALAAIRERLQVETGILGYLLTMVDRRERITWEVEEILKKTFGSLLFRTQIRIDTKIKACPSHRKTIFEYEPPEGRARSDFEQLVREVLERVESRYEKGIE